MSASRISPTKIFLLALLLAAVTLAAAFGILYASHGNSKFLGYTGYVLALPYFFTLTLLPEYDLSQGVRWHYTATAIAVHVVVIWALVMTGASLAVRKRKQQV